jgi:hypothetical protein
MKRERSKRTVDTEEPDHRTLREKADEVGDTVAA